jgi:hypothetical protein
VAAANNWPDKTGPIIAKIGEEMGGKRTVYVPKSWRKRGDYGLDFG